MAKFDIESSDFEDVGALFEKCYIERGEPRFAAENVSDDTHCEKFARKVLKPGLYVVVKTPRLPVTDAVKLKEALEMCTMKAPWLERLDLVNNLAPLAPDLAIHIEKHQQNRENQLKANRKTSYVAAATDPILNDFKREIIFHRQAQSATREGIQRLHELGVATQRPNSYLSEMAKSNEHMQNIGKVLQEQQAGIGKAERMKHLREKRRIGKLTQRYANRKRDEERRKVLNGVRKFRKGKLTNLDFLDDVAMELERVREYSKQSTSKRQTTVKLQVQDAKCGSGERKKGLKRNAKESCMLEEHRSKKRANAKRNRPGKTRRAQEKSRRGRVSE